VEQILESIPHLGDVMVTRSEIKESYGYAWSVTFLQSNWWQGSKYYDVPLLKIAGTDMSYLSEFTSTLVDTTSNTFNGTNSNVTVNRVVTAMSGFEQQVIEIQVYSGVMNGTFSLAYGTQSTPQLLVDASEEEIEKALELLTGVGDVMVHRRNYRDDGETIAIYVIFVETLGNVPMLSADVKNLYSDDGSAVVHVYLQELVSGINPIMESMYHKSTIIDVADETAMVKYTISDLKEGLNYHVRVSPWNGVGASYGAYLGSTPSLVRTLSTPSNVLDIAMAPTSNSSVKVSWKSPTSTGGAPMAMYKVDYDYAAVVTEVQTVSLSSSSSLSGTFCLSFREYSSVGTLTMPQLVD